eukprot:TRINITY_DN41992_c0_g1_i1.p1 TRINITY_DN41992_c0_g1~~TRINITY_DN41992_c0_g1_i1.p1  ORF type:complete len:400 (-),score=157.40 TRINITY_DN41992_c0_g1_i1:155-1354(-)
MSCLEELQAMPEVPSIAHFCSLFRGQFDLIEFEIDEFESALLKQNTDDMFSSTLVERLTIKLVIGCLPMFASNIHEGNFSTYLVQLLQSKREGLEEDGYEVNFEDPFEDNDIEDFSDLSVRDQVVVISQLTEFRLECEDVSGKLKDLDPEGLRVDPLGVDSDNIIYWYFFGTRLYKEVKPMKPKRPKKAKDDDEKVEVEEEKSEPIDPPGWYLVCRTEGEWTELVKKYKKTKKKQDKELYEILNDNFLPDIVKMFEDQEKEERLKLLMANKRSSSRLDRKRDMEEQAFMKRMEEEKRLEMERVAEEAKRKQREKENKQKGREVRAKQREQMGLRVGNDLDALMANRKRIRGDSIEQREEETEESIQTHTRKRNPAMREFQRLSSMEEDCESHGGRNLRF